MGIWFRWVTAAGAACGMAAAGAVGALPASPENHDRLTMAAEAVESAVTAPGAAWVVIDGERMVTGARGTDRDGASITSESQWLWGSVSKPLAGLVSARLACEGRLDLDARVADLLPAYRPNDERAEHITVRQLLNHTSGIAPLLDQLDDDAAGREMAAAVAAVAVERLSTEPGTAHGYSSANYLLLQGVLDEVTGQAYAELVTNELALRGARGMTDRATAKAELIGGRHYVMGSAVRLGDRYDDLGLAYGYLSGSVTDLAAVGASVVTDLGSSGDIGPSGNSRAAEDSGQADAGACAAELATTPSSRANEATAYGLGWRLSTWHGDEVLWHAGAVAGYSSFLGVLPETGAVVVVLQDAYGPLHDATLLAPGVGATNVLAGGDATGAPVPWPYWAALALSVLVVVGLAASAVRSPRSRAAARMRTIGGVMSAVVVLTLPSLVGAGSWAGALRWAPDVGVLAVLAGAAGIATAARGLVGLALCPSGRTAHHGRAPRRPPPSARRRES